jgi:hypothetical protein
VGVIRVAVSGHRSLDERTSELVDAALRETIASFGDDLTGVTCLADGADTLFAQAVLDAGGDLIAVVPALRYRENLPENHWHTYDRLLLEADEVIRLPHVESTSEAHMDASLKMLSRAGQLIAVWDGQPARGFGGTADVVAAARERGLRVTVVWPEGAQRS